MPYQIITPPSEEPITLADAKLHLRVDFSDDDALITALITAARQYAEQLTQTQLVTAKWKLVLDAFPGPALMGIPYGKPYTLPRHAVLLNKAPVQSVDAIKYLDMSSTQQTDTVLSDYAIDLTSKPARITPKFGRIWPITLPEIGAIEIDFTSGYGAATEVPPGIIAWMKMRIGALYENREEISVGQRITVNPLPFVDRLLDPFTVVTY